MSITSSQPTHKRVREDFLGEVVYKLRPKDSGISQNKMRKSSRTRSGRIMGSILACLNHREHLSLEVLVHQCGMKCIFFCSFFKKSISLFGEENGNPLQYSCLENPINGGTW